MDNNFRTEECHCLMPTDSLAATTIVRCFGADEFTETTAASVRYVGAEGGGGDNGSHTNSNISSICASSSMNGCVNTKFVQTLQI